ncbi:YiiQ family protein [Leminorella grimontii]|uniref:YiiQ family protein n=1 Tax=Leminorella grimontii TaxID=82981 RepID=UPI00207ED866|nr:YiiQ family protein [Leminorella grimontii]GKX59445.1 hypothetical protein SOASR031_17600 [Leminorella grimontii]
MLKKTGTMRLLAFTMTFAAIAFAHGEEKPAPAPALGVGQSEPAVAPYLREEAPAFNLTIQQFRDKFNAANPGLTLAEYKIIKQQEDKSPIVRAASRINTTLYSSVALEKSQRQIKSLQLTYLPAATALSVPETAESAAKREKAAAELMTNYMAAFILLFEPTQTRQSCRQKAIELLKRGKGEPFYQQTEGTLRFVIADRGEKGITFALEPIKLSLSDK